LYNTRLTTWVTYDKAIFNVVDRNSCKTPVFGMFWHLFLEASSPRMDVMWSLILGAWLMSLALKERKAPARQWNIRLLKWTNSIIIQDSSTSPLSISLFLNSPGKVMLTYGFIFSTYPTHQSKLYKNWFSSKDM